MREWRDLEGKGGIVVERNRKGNSSKRQKIVKGSEELTVVEYKFVAT